MAGLDGWLKSQRELLQALEDGLKEGNAALQAK